MPIKQIEQARRAAERLRRLAKRRSASMVRVKLGGEGQPIEVPASALEVLADVVEAIASGHRITITSHAAEVSTQKAADLLNVSRPYLIRLLDKGEIPFRMVGTHRRLRLPDVLAYKTCSEADAEKSYRELVAQAHDLAMGYD